VGGKDDYQQGCQIVLDTIYQKTEEIIPNNKNLPIYIKNAKLHQKIGHNICQPVPFQGPPKFTQIGILGLKRYHLATLIAKRSSQF
jgi:hypothetical protein